MDYLIQSYTKTIRDLAEELQLERQAGAVKDKQLLRLKRELIRKHSSKDSDAESDATPRQTEQPMAVMPMSPSFGRGRAKKIAHVALGGQNF